MSELNETFSIGSKYIFKIIGVNFTDLTNQPVLQDSRVCPPSLTLYVLEDRLVPVIIEVDSK